tara:strand:- start:2063 stop:2197 length:135 start_codon:yes stop_codon:yes gene_type:complete
MMTTILDWLRENDRAYGLVLTFMLIGSFGGTAYLTRVMLSWVLP